MSGTEDNAPPPSSQSHFATFSNFTPDDNASFNDEFARLASSQDWVPGSQEYTRERTIALSQELKHHYFSSQPKREGQGLPTIAEDADGAEELTEEQKLEGYKDLCSEVGIAPAETILQCRRLLKSKLVNIVDLIDARRTGKGVEVWENFEAFRAYTLQDGNRIDPEEAKMNGGILTSLLQRLGGRRRGRGGRKRRRTSGVVSGRVTKREPGARLIPVSRA